jgi:dihydroorotase
MLLLNGHIVNENKIFKGSILIRDGKIENIFRGNNISQSILDSKEVLDIEGKYVFPGIIDDQVHFRDPGLTHKGDIYSESKAAIAGGITSYLEMPNTNPQTTSAAEIENKYKNASGKSLANYGFYLGATNNNIEEVKRIDNKYIPGLKVFMGASTGNMLVDNEETLNQIFKHCPTLIATHCEDENTIKSNMNHYHNIYGNKIPIELHPKIRSHEACLKSSSFAVELAKKYGSRLHVLHLSTKDELSLFESDKIENKNITAEVCVHHLWFDESSYKDKGTYIKWNPAIKSIEDKNALFEALLNDQLDVIATDHAPHTSEEKQNDYTKAPSGGPLVQHSLVAMLEFYHQNKISLETIVTKMAHNPANLFKIDKRGFIREGYWADFVVVDLKSKWKVTKDNILYKCKWSPFENYEFSSFVTHTIVNGNIIYNNGKFDESVKGQALLYHR